MIVSLALSHISPLIFVRYRTESFPHLFDALSTNRGLAIWIMISLGSLYFLVNFEMSFSSTSIYWNFSPVKYGVSHAWMWILFHSESFSMNAL